MKRFSALLFLIFLITQSSNALAHAVVMDYSLKIAPVQANQPAQVTLNFNSKIEVGLSQVFLVSEGDKHTTLTIHKGDQQGQIVVDIPPLTAGQYALRLKVLAADGHLTEDVIHFTVSQ
jgi:copper resistance protein C